MMTSEMIAKLRKSLILHEGYKKFPYFDTAKPANITIGIGYNLTDRGVDDDWINNKFNEDINYFYQQLSNFPWFKDLNTDRQIILIDLCFMGWKKFLGFQKLIDALAIHDYQLASLEILNSAWAYQVKNRSTDLAQGMRTGIYEVE